MPSAPLLDLDTLDLDHVEYGIDEIRKCNPQRFEMEQLSGIIRLLPAERAVVAFRDVRADEFWVRGHIPGRPLFPGVLMLEAAAQMSSFVIHHVLHDPRFLGFGGVEDVR